MTELERLEGDANEIYFYTTVETALPLHVGYTNILMSDKTDRERCQIDLWITSIETRLSGSLPESDAKLGAFFYAVETEFEKAIGKGDYKWGLLVSGEIIR